MFTQREWRSMAQISLILMTSEKPSNFACKTRIENCKGASTPVHVVFFSWPTEIFPTSVLIYIVFLILSQHEIWKEKPQRAKTAAKLIITRIDFLNSISAGHTSLIQVYRCHKILNKNYHDINGECRVKLKCYVLSVRSDKTCFIFG